MDVSGVMGQGLVGFKAASSGMAKAAGQVAATAFEVGEPGQLERGLLDLKTSQHVAHANLATIRAGDAQLEELVSLFTR